MRRVGMQASAGLLTPAWPKLPTWPAWRTRVVVVALLVGGIIAAAVITAPHARADDYCTPTNPYPPYQGVCTGGYANYCMLGVACSPVPNTPGTRNPNGYTPICEYASCMPVN